jgi:hypothetical protein
VRRLLPILLLDPADGRVVQRLDVPARGPRSAVFFHDAGLVVAVEGELIGFKPQK